MRYLPKSPADRAAMLQAIGVRSVDDLFAPIPPEFRLKRDLNIPRQMAESEIVDWFKLRAKENGDGYTSFLGAGAYSHYRPVIIDALVQRGEFLTSYTPYQAEFAQGTLQAIFEFQTMISELTGMEVANASMYDGSTGAAEAVMMAVRITGRNGAVSRGAGDVCHASGHSAEDSCVCGIRARRSPRITTGGQRRYRVHPDSVPEFLWHD
jgi:glycine dehydrogenase subunit 1